MTPTVGVRYAVASRVATPRLPFTLIIIPQQFSRALFGEPTSAPTATLLPQKDTLGRSSRALPSSHLENRSFSCHRTVCPYLDSAKFKFCTASKTQCLLCSFQFAGNKSLHHSTNRTLAEIPDPIPKQVAEAQHIRQENGREQNITDKPMQVF